MPKAIVVGGGYAGVSAATALAEAGVAVDLLESRGFLGGRVYSTAPSDPFPAQVDNGPHLFMGCYQETLRLLERLGEKDALRWIDPLGLDWLVPGGGKVGLHCLSLPAPLHLATGLLLSNAFPLVEKFRMVTALRTFAKKPFKIVPGLATVGDLLDATRQGPVSRERFWGPLTRAVMNLPPETASLEGMGEVLHRVFFAKRSDSALGISARPLSGIGFPQVASYLSARGGQVHLHEGVRSFDPDGRVPTVTTGSGKDLTADVLVWAVPPSTLSALWPKETWLFADHAEELGKSPIVSVHVILKEPLLQGDLLGLSGARFEWVFNRNENWGWKGAGPLRGAQYLSFTASAAEDLARMKDPELLGLALQELVQRLPVGEELKVLHSKVTREMAATFAWTSAAGPLRPPCETPIPGVFLAGDWTDTGLPATIEGACLSGHKAAKAVLASLPRAQD
jgi:hydroxysqualene dehydroxylase